MQNNGELPFRLEGYVEGLRGGAFCGWLWCVGHPGIKPRLDLVIDGSHRIKGIASSFREDLQDAGQSDGCAGYALNVPHELLDDQIHNIELSWSLNFGGAPYTGTITNETIHFSYPDDPGAVLIEQDPVGAPPPTRDAPFELEGFADGMRGRAVSGWVWCIGYPDIKPSVTVAVDGKIVGETIAAEFREDLRDDNRSNGYAAYDFPLPLDVLDGEPHDLELTWTVVFDGRTYSGPLTAAPLRIRPPKVEPLPASWLISRTSVCGDAGTLIRGHDRISAPAVSAALALLSRQQPVSVIVHVDNAAAEVAGDCLDALIKHTTFAARLVIVDDGTTDPGVQRRLQRLSRESGALIWRSPQVIGFAACIDLAIARTVGDVAVLRGSVRVPPGWLQGLVCAAARGPDVGVVIPLSTRFDDGGPFADLDEDDLARRVARFSHRLLLDTPGLPSECLFLRRGVLEQVGRFTESAGGEAGDVLEAFSRRAVEAGWSCVLADDVLIRDNGAARPPTTDDVDEAAHGLRVRRFLNSDGYEFVRRSVALVAADRGSPPRPRLLYVLSPPDHSGTPLISQALAQRIHGNYESWFVWGDTDTVTLAIMTDDAPQPVAKWKLNATLIPWDHRRADVDAVLHQILRQFAIELVHCRQIVQLGPSIMRIAHLLGVPVVLSFHDYYMLCPTVTLIDGNGRYCGGDCDKGTGECRSFFIPEHLLRLRNGWTHAWRKTMTKAFDHVDAFVTTTPAAHAVIASVYPQLRDRDFRIIEHGRTFAERRRLETCPSRERPVRVLALGNYNDAKGMQTVLDLADLDRDGRLDLHWLGAVPGVMARPAAGTYHGPYEPHTVEARIHEIAPDFVLLLSVWAETYCHTLSEAWAAGVPVIGSCLGAIGERIDVHGGGWTVDPHDAQMILDLIERLSLHTDEYRQVAEKIPRIPIRPTEDMVDDYLALYDAVIRQRRRPGARMKENA
jgi:glycosyltransferase involved in cell wall biosynthesis/GT2 family glycosyltransferase